MSFRHVLVGAGFVFILAAVLPPFAGRPGSVGLALAGAALVLGTLFERVVYKRLDTTRPGPAWRRSAERFVDPASGKHVTVFVDPRTGERRYVEDATQQMTQVNKP
jgi:hypothetical protein